MSLVPLQQSMDWFKGKFTGNHRFSDDLHGKIYGFRLKISLEPIQSNSNEHRRLLLRPESFYKDYDIEVLKGATVTKLNTKDQIISYTSQVWP